MQTEAKGQRPRVRKLEEKKDRTTGNISSQSSPNTTSPATSTNASTDRVDEALGRASENSSAEPNPSNWRKMNPLVANLVAVDRHRLVGSLVWVALDDFGCCFGSAAPRILRRLRPMQNKPSE